jgi:hypothetical protein
MKPLRELVRDQLDAAAEVAVEVFEDAAVLIR